MFLGRFLAPPYQALGRQTTHSLTWKNEVAQGGEGRFEKIVDPDVKQKS